MAPTRGETSTFEHRTNSDIPHAGFFFCGLEALAVQEQVRTKTSSHRRQYPPTPSVFPPSHHFKDSLAVSQGTNNIRFTRLVIKKFYKVFSASFLRNITAHEEKRRKNKEIPHPSWSKTMEWNVAGGLFYVLPHTTLFPHSNYYSNVPRHNKSFPGNAAFFILRRRSRGEYFPVPFPSCQLPEIVGGGAELITDDCSRYSDGQSFRALSLWASHPDFYIFFLIYPHFQETSCALRHILVVRASHSAKVATWPVKMNVYQANFCFHLSGVRLLTLKNIKKDNNNNKNKHTKLWLWMDGDWFSRCTLSLHCTADSLTNTRAHTQSRALVCHRRAWAPAIMIPLTHIGAHHSTAQHSFAAEGAP